MCGLHAKDGIRNWTSILTSKRSHISFAIIIATVVVVSVQCDKRAQAESSTDSNLRGVELTQLLKVARDELDTTKLSRKEIELRLAIIEDVATVKAYFPHAYGGRPETRNANYWAQNDNGEYIPRGKPTESIKDLWRTTSGIRCRKLSTLVMLKGLIDVSDSKQLAELDDMLRGKVIPNELPNDGIGTLFDRVRPKHGQVFRNDEFLAGDEVWFDNPYFEQLSEKQQSKYRGQEGHHVFYIGGGNVMDMYGREPVSIDDFRNSFLNWGSVKIAVEAKERAAKPEDFQIKAVRRVIADRAN